VVRILLGLPLLLGLNPFIFGCLLLQYRSASSASLIGLDVFFILGGAVMAGSLLWLLVIAGRSRLPLWIGGSASILNALAVLLGTLTETLPCSGPT
jgi:hypothetical protein